MTAAPAMRRFALATLSAALALSIAGCASDAPPPPCPPAGTPAPLDSITLFAPGGGRDLTEVRFSGRISSVQTVCDYDDKGVDVDLAVDIRVERGPADKSRQADLQYFVAVEDGPGNITAKQVFDVAVPFEGNSRRLARREELSLRIPAPTDGFKQTRVLVGFQLTPEQLEFNRRQRP